jgi:hypothetical protein
VGVAVPPDARDLRPMELGAIVPLLGCLLFLSAWPASISGHSFPGDRPKAHVESQFTQAAP